MAPSWLPSWMIPPMPQGGSVSQEYGTVPDVSAAVPWNFTLPKLADPAGLQPGETGHWEYPDYSALLQGDPGYINANAAAVADASSAARQRANLAKAAIIGFGGTPASWGNQFGDITAADIAAAQQNPYSTLATLTRQRGQGNTDLAAQLAARGILSSGALTGGQQALQNSQEEAQYNATQSLLAALGGYGRDWANAVRTAQGNRLTALSDAASRIQQLFTPQWLTDTKPTPPTPQQQWQTAHPVDNTTWGEPINQPWSDPTTGYWAGIDPQTGEPFKAGQGLISGTSDYTPGKVAAGTVGMDIPLAPYGHSLSDYIPDYSKVDIGDWKETTPTGAGAAGPAWAYPGTKPVATPTVPKLPTLSDLLKNKPTVVKKAPSSVPSSIGSFIR